MLSNKPRPACAFPHRGPLPPPPGSPARPLPQKSSKARAPLKKNPLRNLGAMLKLNPYAKAARRMELLAAARSAGAAAGGGPGAPGGCSACWLCCWRAAPRRRASRRRRLLHRAAPHPPAFFSSPTDAKAAKLAAARAAKAATRKGLKQTTKAFYGNMVTDHGGCWLAVLAVFICLFGACSVGAGRGGVGAAGSPRALGSQQPTVASFLPLSSTADYVGEDYEVFSSWLGTTQ